MDTFLYSIRVICLYSSINIKLESSVIEKRLLFLILANLCKFSENCSPSVIPSIQILFRIKLVSISTKTTSGRGL